MKERIKLIMDNAGLTQQEFAVKLGISPASLSSIFTGRTNPTNNHVMAIHRVFPQINVNWLLFGEGEMNIGNADFSASEEEEKSDTLSAHHEEETDSTSLSTNGTPITPRSLFDVGPEVTPTTHHSTLPSSPSSNKKDTRTTIRGNGQVMTANNIAMEREDRKIKEIRVFYSNGTYESFVPSNK